MRSPAALPFNRFRSLYNDERPHDALGGQTPSSRYVASQRPYPERLPPLEYPGHFLVKRVTNAGTFRLKHKLLFIANALKQHHIGLEETDDGTWSIYFATVLLVKVDEREMIIRDGPLLTPHPQEVLPIIPANLVTYLPGCSHESPSEQMPSIAV